MEPNFNNEYEASAEINKVIRVCMALNQYTNFAHVAEHAGVNKKTLEGFLRPSSRIMKSESISNLREHLNDTLHAHLSRHSARHLMNGFEHALETLITCKTNRNKGLKP